MTSVGKTFTMQGGEGSIGLVQLSTYDLIRSLNLRYSLSEFRVMISYVEVYNEVLLVLVVLVLVVLLFILLIFPLILLTECEGSSF